MAEIRLIDREELKAKLARGDRFRLAMALSKEAFAAKHIPGSVNLHTKEDALAMFDPGDEIVVYCTSPSCNSSIMAYHFLVSRGYTNVRRYAGGLQDWEEAGLPLESGPSA